MSTHPAWKLLLNCTALLLLPLTTEPATAAEGPPEGFTALFNGEDFSGWHGMGHVDPRQQADLNDEQKAKNEKELKEHWSIEGDEIVNDGQGPYLTTDKHYGDIELRLEYKTVAKADSGIYLRGTPQVQIWDSTKEGGKWEIGADKGSGGLWNNSPGAKGKDPLVLADKPFGQWNQIRIVQVGARTWVWLNDKKVVDGARMENFWDRSQPLFKTGPIQLQTHGGEIRWRNIYLREIEPEEANQWLAKTDQHQFDDLLADGLDGWKGARDNYEVADGVLRCLPGHGGTVYTPKSYGDFVVRTEIRLPAGGNNGLAIRFPGEGNPAFDGMCELQVLDNTAEKYAKLDPRQYHGSAYGLAAAHRGFLRPVGVWNFQQTTVRGSKIQVELNGYLILDADLSEVEEFMGDQAHPGKDLQEGHFGFAGHNDAVEFRNVKIRKL